MEPRHAFFETDDFIELSIFVKDVKEESATIHLMPRKVSFAYDDKLLNLDPLQGEIDVEQSITRVGKVKVEIRLKKKYTARWGALVGEAPVVVKPAYQPDAETGPLIADPKLKKKNWDSLATEALELEGKEKTSTEDPNSGGDAAVNGFFQQIFAGADDDTRRAMLKSYTESGGTSLSTDWNEVSKGKVEPKPPSGSEARNW